MTRREALTEFKRTILPLVQARHERNGVIDRPARREAWNNWTDALCKEGRITMKQYETWAAP
jgi:hypothetical protein